MSAVDSAGSGVPPDAAAAAVAAADAASHSLGLVLAVLASAGNNIGKALQKRGTADLPRMSLERKVLAAYARHSTWRLGFVLDVSGAVLMLFALQQAPLSVVQPIAGSGMAVLAVFSHAYLREELRRIEWLGVAVAAMGTIGVGTFVTPTRDDDELRLRWAGLALLAAMVLTLAGLELLVRAIHARGSIVELSPRARALHELGTGVQGGLLFGLSAAASRAALVLSRQLGSPLCIPVGVGLSVLITAGGFFLQSRGLKDGRAVVVCTYAAISTIATGVLIGLIALAEPLPQSASELLGWSLSLAAIVLGVVLLVQRGVRSTGIPDAGSKHAV